MSFWGTMMVIAQFILCFISLASTTYSKEVNIDYLNKMLAETLLTGYFNETAKSITELYKIERIITKKSLGPIFAARVKKGNWPGHDFMDGEILTAEVFYHRHLHHPNIIELLNHHETRDFYILVLERPEKSLNLLDYMKSKESANVAGIQEKEAAQIFRQMINGVVYSETMEGIFHGDIKSENVIVDTETGVAKLIDFGLAAFVTESPFSEFVGTTTHCPPEFFSTGFYESSTATIWQLGCTLFDLLSGDLPFLTLAKLSDGELPSNMSFDFSIPSHLSPGAKSLLGHMLAINPKERATLDDVVHHPWLQ